MQLVLALLMLLKLSSKHNGRKADKGHAQHRRESDNGSNFDDTDYKQTYMPATSLMRFQHELRQHTNRRQTRNMVIAIDIWNETWSSTLMILNFLNMNALTMLVRELCISMTSEITREQRIDSRDNRIIICELEN